MQMSSNIVTAGVAVLVDGENIPQSLGGQIITKCLPIGRATVQRISGM